MPIHLMFEAEKMPPFSLVGANTRKISPQKIGTRISTNISNHMFNGGQNFKIGSKKDSYRFGPYQVNDRKLKYI